MQASLSAAPTATTRSIPLWAAWVTLLLVSDAPNIAWRIFAPDPDWLSEARLAAAAVFVLVSFLWEALRPLRPFYIVVLALLALMQASAWVGSLQSWQALFGGSQATFASGYAGIQLRELVAAGVLLLLLALLFKDRRAFFLARGKLDAPLEPVPWLGIHAGETWKKFGWIFAACMFTAGLVWVILSALPMPKLDRVVPLLPFIVLFAALNALGEELTFRAPLLAALHRVVGREQALWLTALFFGSLHVLYGAPAGLPGFLLTGFVAYLFGKSMLETGGVFWAWFMHFVADIPIFLLIALSML